VHQLLPAAVACCFCLRLLLLLSPSGVSSMLSWPLHVAAEQWWCLSQPAHQVLLQTKPQQHQQQQTQQQQQPMVC
jgi:organic hydroperoxide reductase OsmC/OhrA